MTAPTLRPRSAGPVLALLFNSLVWGVSWWPFRHLQARGLHPLWATAGIYLVSSAAILLWRPAALRQLAGRPALWVIFFASGTTNAAFNWAVSIGDVVRVVLLFYLMPLWSLLLARLLLKEPLTRGAIGRVALALGGAALVLSQGGQAGGDGLLASLNPADVLALLGGFAFALNNVMLRREAAQTEAARGLAMFLGGAFVASLVGAALSTPAAGGGAGVHWPSAPDAWLWPALGLSAAFMASNMCLQYGAARLSATITAVVMPCEVLFAALTSVWWGGATLHASVVLGGVLILLAALASVVENRA